MKLRKKFRAAAYLLSRLSEICSNEWPPPKYLKRLIAQTKFPQPLWSRESKSVTHRKQAYQHRHNQLRLSSPPAPGRYSKTSVSAVTVGGRMTRIIPPPGSRACAASLYTNNVGAEVSINVCTWAVIGDILSSTTEGRT